ncbi:hypothetical protein [Clostridium botulinum]|uniref:hypothetical protein n=1 Tax=Clostridium botulinum TaxID=1491 RepID=UPI001E5C9AC1|nr:hypothetical protein [Clostridium botulinum]MCD3254348.1 hypothetical protein [Clostridium botulinum C/D]MCD3279848.1 hypothetical protein [Clostridium botulinum C/D]MCD3339579.1 hypothetical protein [Clostridium botulinum C/D]MCD3357487.1 hypothetical protein [Clostridium botulinum C/D]
MTPTYQPVYKENQGIFNNPRQKMWMVMHYYSGDYGSGWTIDLFTNSFFEAKAKTNDLLRNGTRLDRIIVSEVTPIDNVIVPSV